MNPDDWEYSCACEDEAMGPVVDLSHGWVNEYLGDWGSD